MRTTRTTGNYMLRRKVRNAYEQRVIDKKRGRRPSAAAPPCLGMALKSHEFVPYFQRKLFEGVWNYRHLPAALAFGLLAAENVSGLAGFQFAQTTVFLDWRCAPPPPGSHLGPICSTICLPLQCGRPWSLKQLFCNVFGPSMHSARKLTLLRPFCSSCFGAPQKSNVL